MWHRKQAKGSFIPQCIISLTPLGLDRQPRKIKNWKDISLNNLYSGFTCRLYIIQSADVSLLLYFCFLNYANIWIIFERNAYVSNFLEPLKSCSLLTSEVVQEAVQRWTEGTIVYPEIARPFSFPSECCVTFTRNNYLRNTSQRTTGIKWRCSQLIYWHYRQENSNPILLCLKT